MTLEPARRELECFKYDECLDRAARANTKLNCFKCEQRDQSQLSVVPKVSPGSQRKITKSEWDEANLRYRECKRCGNKPDDPMTIAQAGGLAGLCVDCRPKVMKERKENRQQRKQRLMDELTKEKKPETLSLDMKVFEKFADLFRIARQVAERNFRPLEYQIIAWISEGLGREK